MASGKINKQTSSNLTTETVTGSTTSAQYDGYYYVDIPVSNADKIIAAIVTNMSNNQSAFCQIIGTTSIRVWTKLANASMSVRITKLGGVVRKIRKALIHLAFRTEGRWA